MNKFVTISAIFSLLLPYILSFDPLTLTVGSTAFVLSGSQTALAVVGLAGLAIAKEKLILASLSRGKRDVMSKRNETPNLDGFFRAIGESDVSDCGKLLVCHVMATPSGQQAIEEKLIANLFDDLENIDPNSHKAAYQFAAYVGTLAQPDLCRQRYSRCTVPISDLLSIVEAHSGNQI